MSLGELEEAATSFEQARQVAELGNNRTIARLQRAAPDLPPAPCEQTKIKK
jgi:hypothetical protein